MLGTGALIFKLVYVPSVVIISRELSCKRSWNLSLRAHIILGNDLLNNLNRRSWVTLWRRESFDKVSEVWHFERVVVEVYLFRCFFELGRNFTVKNGLGVASHLVGVSRWATLEKLIFEWFCVKTTHLSLMKPWSFLGHVSIFVSFKSLAHAAHVLLNIFNMNVLLLVKLAVVCLNVRINTWGCGVLKYLIQSVYVWLLIARRNSEITTLTILARELLV